MDWAKLTTSERFYSEQLGDSPATSDGFTLFQQDAQRILYSSAFRRMQGKTQVHPFPIYDYLRTRLTHTIEVANVGRSIATRIAQELQKSSPEIRPIDWGDIVYSACLIHDIGNPPFGHVGEYAIRSWFEDNKDRDGLREVLDDEHQVGDFLGFEGNAQGFRIATRLSGWRDQGGLRLTNSVLASFIKYPYSSAHRHGRLYERLKKTKFGFTYDDRNAVRKVFGSVGITCSEDGLYRRHPFAYIVEAADDICYLTTDIEDAFRMSHLQFNAAEALLEPIAAKGADMSNYKNIPEKEELDRIAFLRSGAIVTLSDIAVRRFIDNKDTIVKDQLTTDLINDDLVAKELADISTACKEKVYKERRKLEIESAGITILHYLLDNFALMAISKASSRSGNLKTKDRHLFDLLPRAAQKRLEDAGGDCYRALLVATDHVSGMTDRYAHEVFLKLNGTSPLIGRMN